MKNGLMVEACDAKAYSIALEKLRDDKQTISFLQAPFYGAWQERDGKTVVYFTAASEGVVVAAGLAVKYDAPGGISFLYCPYGPVVKTWSDELLNSLRSFFASVARETGATFVRLDSDGLLSVPGVKPVANQLAITASLQPRAEWLLDISGSQEDIWMGFHKHARYNVRLAERAEAKIDFYAPTEAPLETFFSLMQTTAGRDSFSIQSRDYYTAVLQSIPAVSGFVAICTIDGKPVAAGIFASYDGMVHYVFAGSSNDFRKIAPPYFVVWNAILEAKRRGWHTLNFGGVTDDVKGTHLAGVTGFKSRFGGYRVSHKNPVDLVYKRWRYAAFRLYKRLRG